MDREKLLRAMQHASENPEFAIELRKRIASGEFNDILKKEGIDTSRFEKPKKEGFFKKAGKALIKSEREFGKSIAGAIDVFTGLGGSRMVEEAQALDAKTVQQLTSRIKEKREKGEDVTKFLKILEDMKGTPQSELLKRQASLSTRQVLGQAGGVTLDVVGGGTLGTKAAGVVTKPTTFLGGFARGAATGATTGGAFGAGQGVARGLQEDQRVSPEPAVNTFLDDLDDIGVRFRRGNPVFGGSDIEGITPAENLITKVVERAKNVSDDANELHKLKKFIDEQVTFGRTGEGLSGRTERILKGFRNSIDEVLDTTFDSYNQANSRYSEAIRLFDTTKSVLGNKFDPSQGTIRAGAVARRILGNSANRGDILEFLQNLN